MVDDERERDDIRGPAADPRVEAGIDHLQTAATELIGAARAFLDVIEEVVTDRDRMTGAAESLGAVAEAVVRGARRAGLDRSPSGAPADPPEERPSNVQPIKVS